MIRNATGSKYSEVQELLQAYSMINDQIIVNLSIWEVDGGWKARIVTRKAAKNGQQSKPKSTTRIRRTKRQSTGIQPGQSQNIQINRNA